MRSRLLGKSGLTVSELSLGTWGLSGDGYGPVLADEQAKVIDRAVALGITCIETADVYGNGAMEKLIGERVGKNAAVHIVTKIGTDRAASPARKRFDAKYLESALEASRKRLQRDVLDVVLLHNPAAVTIARGEPTRFLTDQKAKGNIRAWGVSAGSVAVARAALERGAEVVSLAYNVFLSRDLKDLDIDIQRTEAGVLVRSVLSHGLLCGYWSMYKEFPPKDHRSERWTGDELRRRMQQLSPLRSAFNADITTQRAVALRYALAGPHVGSVITGPKNTLQLDQLIREAGKEPPYLSQDQLNSLHFRLGQLGVAT